MPLSPRPQVRRATGYTPQRDTVVSQSGDVFSLLAQTLLSARLTF